MLVDALFPPSFCLSIINPVIANRIGSELANAPRNTIRQAVSPTMAAATAHKPAAANVVRMLQL